MKSIVILAILFAFAKTENYYKGIDTHVIPLSEKNWGNQVIKARTNQKVVIIHFTKSNDGKSYDISQDFEKQAEKMRGIFSFTGVDCDANHKLCIKEGITEFPSIKIYPPLPIPPFVPEANFDVKRICAWAAGYVPDNVNKITDDNINGILNTNPSIPKVVLFTEKSKVPLLWKGISNAFKDNLFIGICNKNQTDVVYKFNANKFPSIMVHKTGEKRPIIYTGKFGYQKIFDFLNVYSEQFVATDNSANSGPEGEKPWLNAAVPELHLLSGSDICLGAHKVLCVIYFNKEKPSKEVFDILKEIRRDYDNHLKRSFSFKFMWADSDKQNAWIEKFGIESSPSTIILNPGRRKRFIKIPGQLTYDIINNQLEKILGGDSRFKPLRPNEVPPLV